MGPLSDLRLHAAAALSPWSRAPSVEAALALWLEQVEGKTLTQAGDHFLAVAFNLVLEATSQRGNPAVLVSWHHKRWLPSTQGADPPRG